MERKLRQEAENKARVMGEKINFDGKVFGEACIIIIIYELGS